MLIQTSAADFFGLTKASNKKLKDWWNSEIKAARKKVKENVKQHRNKAISSKLRKNGKGQKRI